MSGSGSFKIGDCVVEQDLDRISRGSEVVTVRPQVMDVLVYLASRGGQIVHADELLESLWPEKVVTSASIYNCITELRHAFLDCDDGQPYIDTVPKRGYRIVTPVTGLDEAKAAASQIDASPFSLRLNYSLSFVFVTALAVALVYFAYDKFVVGRMLEEAPATTSTRFEDISETDRWEVSIAVLPFVNMSDGPDNEIFSDGLSEEIRNLLARIPHLKVIGRTSSLAYTQENEDLRAIGRMLGVKTVLEGAVRMSGDRLRISAQLIDVSDGSYLWSETYHRTMTNIFELQDDIAAAIIDALQLHISENPTRGRPTEVAEAYALFLKARVSLKTQDQQTAESALLQATELDPNFAEAHELLAHLYQLRTSPGIETEATKLMRGAAAKALAIDADLVFARALYQAGNTENYSLPDVIEAFLQAARERPNDSAILRTLTWDLMITGYLGEALQTAERFVDVDPLSSVAHNRYSAALLAAGRVSESIAALKVADALTPFSMDWYFGEINLAENRDEAAIKLMEAYVRQTENTDPAWVEDLVIRGRDPVSGQAYLDERIPAIVQSIHPDDPSGYQGGLARWHMFFGDLDRYFEIILSKINDDSAWAGVDMHIFYGTAYRYLGFTAHPKYLEVAKLMGYIDVWEQRGPPDFCKKVEGHWVCE